MIVQMWGKLLRTLPSYLTFGEPQRLSRRTVTNLNNLQLVQTCLSPCLLIR